MLNRDLLYYSTREKTASLKFSAGPANDTHRIGPDEDTPILQGSPLIPWTTAVFIEDTREMWLRGKLWDLSGACTLS